jgi:hypothetical protein
VETCSLYYRLSLSDSVRTSVHPDAALPSLRRLLPLVTCPTRDARSRLRSPAAGTLSHPSRPFSSARHGTAGIAPHLLRPFSSARASCRGHRGLLQREGHSPRALHPPSATPPLCANIDLRAGIELCVATNLHSSKQ